MATGDRPHRPHLFPENTRTVEGFTAKSIPVPKDAVAAKDREQHAAALRAQLAQVEIALRSQVAEQRQAGLQSAIGIQVEFRSEPDVTMAAESLARDSRGIELLNLRQPGTQVLATVFVPDGKLTHFEKLITEYVGYKVDRNGDAIDHRTLIDAIRSLHIATFESLWTDSAGALPGTADQAIWWEAWLPVGADPDRTLADFRKVADRAGMRHSERVLRFPERMVVQLHGSQAQLIRSTLLLHRIAELRRAKTTAEFFAAMPADEQEEWEGHLLARLAPVPAGDAYVTLLDTGVNHGHPLLAPFVADADRHTIEPGWGPDDENGHGSELAGLALMGNLTPALEEDALLQVHHRLESVKVLRRGGDNEGESFGAITAEAVGRVEITAAERRRVFAMAVSSTDGRDQGRPSAWSAQVDRLASDFDGDGATPRLFVLCAGNTDNEAFADYPDGLSTSSIHDPGQAWNALTVGAYSDMTTPSASAPAYRPLAAAGALSPYTTTSMTWQNGWPFKPDIVMEGGNVAIDPTGFTSRFDSLSLLTTSHRPSEGRFATTWATSAATGLAAGMCARIAAAYPQFWPETIRGLMVHSARWTQAMEKAYLPDGRRNMNTQRNLLRHCGYGVPSLERALYSAGNSLTMVVQNTLQPYKKDKGAPVKTSDMHLHALPWPNELLEDMGEMQVRLRITLSYFIEPNPGERGGIDKYAYQSHALRFAVRRPLESEAAFRRRINAQAEAEENGSPDGAPADAGWMLGERLRARGSLLSDTWTGTAAELANRGQLAIFPAMGWWRKRASHGRFNRLARYSLLVSIEAPEAEQDLYAAIAQRIASTAPVAAQVVVSTAT